MPTVPQTRSSRTAPSPPHGYTVADLRDLVLATSDERDLALKREKAAYRRGRAVGRAEGWALCTRWRDAQWHNWVTDAPIPGAGLDYSELSARRWGPGGREHFADPRPGDFPGRES